jgi:hypothetical protein
VQDFVVRFLPSVEHLEIFIVLQRNTARSWSAREIATQVRISEAAAARVLERLASDNFLAVRISNDILYRFNPANDALRALSAGCADWYGRERISMIKLLTDAIVSPLDE